eukprot:3638341-Pleurochrysis_carterae.AAC.1
MECCVGGVGDGMWCWRGGRWNVALAGWAMECGVGGVGVDGSLRGGKGSEEADKHAKQGGKGRARQVAGLGKRESESVLAGRG